MRTGLVLEGGGMRGIYTAGVLDVFMENNIEVDGVIGVSAGAIHGCTYVAGQQGRSIRYNKKYCSNWRYMSFRSFVATGDLVGKKFCYEEIPNRLDPFDFKTFGESRMDFYAVVTNLETGKPEYLKVKKPDELMDCIRASASLPLVSRIVEIDGKKYLDGGTSDSIPFMEFRKEGFERLIVVTTRPEGYVKEPEKLLSLMKLKYRKYPAYVECCKNRHIVYNENLKKLKELEEKGEILVIRPTKTIDIGRMEHNQDKIQAQYEVGEKDALDRLKEIKDFLKG